MLEGERPSYVSGTGELDKNAMRSSIETTELTIEALKRQRDSIPEQAVASIDAQIRDKQRKLDELKEKMEMN